MPKPPRQREIFSSLKSHLLDFREKCSEQREPNRLLRMQDPFPSSFSKEKCRRCSCRPTIASAHLLISPPPSRPSERSSSPSVSRSCARGQPWSLHAWRPSPPSIVSRGPSQPWRGGSIRDCQYSILTGSKRLNCVTYVLNEGTLVLEGVTLGGVVQLMVEVLVDLARGTVLDQQTTQDPLTAHPENLPKLFCQSSFSRQLSIQYHVVEPISSRVPASSMNSPSKWKLCCLP